MFSYVILDRNLANDLENLSLDNIVIKPHYCWQVIPIKNHMVLSKIHQTYRIGYLKVQSHELF